MKRQVESPLKSAPIQKNTTDVSVNINAKTFLKAFLFLSSKSINGIFLLKIYFVNLSREMCSIKSK